MIEGKINGQDLAIINYYGPTTDKQTEQIEYISKLYPHISELSHKLIMGGDFNTCLAPGLDRYKNKNEKPTKFADRLNNLIEEFDLVGCLEDAKPR